MFFLELDIDSFVNILFILKIFEIISGLKIHLSKSILVGVNVDCQFLTAFAM